MRFRKNGMMMLCVLCMIGLAAGCSRKQEGERPSKFQDSKEYMYLTTKVESDEGVYYIKREEGYQVLKYIDKKSAKETVLCQKLNCKHDSKECQAVLEYPNYMGHMAYSDGKLYSLEVRYDNKQEIQTNLGVYQMNPDGTGRKLIHGWKSIMTPPNAGGIYKGKIILSLPLIVEEEDGIGSTVGGSSLVIYDIETKKETRITDIEESMNKYFEPCGGSGDSFYFFEMGLQDDTGYIFKRYDFQTGKIQAVWEGKRDDAQVIENDTLYLCADDKKSIDAYNLKTLERETILEWEEDVTAMYAAPGFLTLVQIRQEDGSLVGSWEEWYKLNKNGVHTVRYYQWYDLGTEQFLFDRYIPESEMTVELLFDNGYWIEKENKKYFYNIEDGTWKEIREIS